MAAQGRAQGLRVAGGSIERERTQKHVGSAKQSLDLCELCESLCRTQKHVGSAKQSLDLCESLCRTQKHVGSAKQSLDLCESPELAHYALPQIEVLPDA